MAVIGDTANENAEVHQTYSEAVSCLKIPLKV